ncbi:hypothetical protein EDD86DRAFT_213075 [Gorgonomyces haynaldii]|nr:hypothetical protein EDD86DRAFT_213075 [Gorgonomyces haynaldii]
MLIKKSVNVPGIGAFHVKKSKKVTNDKQTVFSAFFVPAVSWEKLPGYKVDRSFLLELQGMSGAEPLNFYSVAQQTGFSREMVEAGLKDIVNALIRVLRRGSAANLSTGNLGKLVFQNQDVKFKFTPNFMNLLNDTKKVEKKPVEIQSKPQTAEKPQIQEKQEQKKELTFECPPKPQEAPVQEEIKVIIEEHTNNKPVHEIAVNNAATLEALHKLEDATEKLQKLEQLIDSTFSPESRNTCTHQHHHSGNRQWSDKKCPICRQDKIKFTDERDVLKKLDKDHDKLYLHLSLQKDNEYFAMKKEAEKVKEQEAATTAHYNRLRAVEHQIQMQKESLPVGNIFEKRKLGHDPQAPFIIAEKLREQMAWKRERMLREKEQHDVEEKLLSEAVQKENKAAELGAHMDKLQKCAQQREALAEQIRIRQENKEPIEPPSKENPYARSESLMALYQREKAKQLYQEQLAIVRQRQSYASKVADIEKRHSLERLALSRKELEKDLRSIKHGKAEQRKSLETYWKEQIDWKEKLKRELEASS